MRRPELQLAGYLVVWIALLASSLRLPAAEATSKPAAAPAEELDEVTVTGVRRSELRAAVIKAEEVFLARYNELNKDDDLDINCMRYTPTGTRLSYRYCYTMLQERGQRNDASEVMTFMRNLDVPNGQQPPNRDTTIWLMERRDDYRKNLVKLLQDNPDLRELVKLRAEALRRYEASK